MQTYKVVITERAKLDIIKTTAYIKDDKAAEKYRKEIYERLKDISKIAGPFPKKYFSSGKAYKSIRHKNHMAFFRVDEENQIAYVVRIFRGNQNYQSEL